MAFPLGREIVSRRSSVFASGAPDDAKSRFRRFTTDSRRIFIDVNAKITEEIDKGACVSALSGLSLNGGVGADSHCFGAEMNLGFGAFFGADWRRIL
ncbi:MAG TPA: hypothetical protein VHB77_22480 [Planctomycetaceae bacterium]|nr:hypothetical protein [Planctomycetaceae bacterium]